MLHKIEFKESSSPPIFLNEKKPEPTTFTTSNALQKRLDSTAVSDKFSQ